MESTAVLEVRPRPTGDIWALVAAAVAPSLAALWYVYGAGSPGTVQAVYFVSKLVIFPFPLVWWLLAERRRSGIVPTMTRGRDLLVGLATGAGIALLIGLGYWLGIGNMIDAESLRQEVKDFGAYDRFVLLATFLCIINSGLEEYYWRWFLFGRLRRHTGLPAALILAAVAFAAHHFVVLQDFLDNVALSAFLSAGVAVGGIIWGLQYHRSGRLGGIWLSHFLVDVAAMSCAYHLLFPGSSS